MALPRYSPGTGQRYACVGRKGASGGILGRRGSNPKLHKFLLGLTLADRSPQIPRRGRRSATPQCFQQHSLGIAAGSSLEVSPMSQIMGASGTNWLILKHF